MTLGRLSDQIELVDEDVLRRSLDEYRAVLARIGHLESEAARRLRREVTHAVRVVEDELSRRSGSTGPLARGRRDAPPNVA